MSDFSLQTSSVFTAVNSIATEFLQSIDNSIYSTLDDITFIDSNILNDSFIVNILGKTANSGLLLLCNSLLLGCIIYYLVSLILSHIITFKLHPPSQFIFKLILISILLNSSYDICGFFLDLNSNISNCILEIGEDLFNSRVCFSTLGDRINNTSFWSAFNFFSLQGLFKSFSSVGIINLVLAYSLRYIMIKIFILLFPFAIISLLNQSTSYFFKNYIKSFVALLFTQSIISLVLLLVFSLDFSSNTLFSHVVFIGALYFLSKVSYFVKDLLGGVSIFAFSNATSLRNFLKGGF